MWVRRKCLCVVRGWAYGFEDGGLAVTEGVFISFEGGDGSGKSTQIERARQWFVSRGNTVRVTREPGGTDLGIDIRRLVQNGPEDVDSRTEALLYAADRAYHVATVIRPALERGEVVLTDRYIDSSLAYQGAARDLGVEEINSLSQWATDGLQASLTFLLDLPPEVGARRRTDRPDRLERESLDFHERVRHEYLRLADAQPERFVVIDAVGTPDEVFTEIRGVLEERFPVAGDCGELDGHTAKAPGAGKLLTEGAEVMDSANTHVTAAAERGEKTVERDENTADGGENAAEGDKTTSVATVQVEDSPAPQSLHAIKTQESPLLAGLLESQGMLWPDAEGNALQ